MSHKAQIIIHIGEVFASREPAIIKTLLGSCIAACLRDPVTRIGGMNHFMLPAPPDAEAEGDLSRFGIHAMELLIGEIQKRGGERERLQAKVFGGGHVLQIAESADGVPQKNIRFIQEFLTVEGIPLVAHDVGGRAARQVLFHTDSGSALVKRFSGQAPGTDAAEREHQERARRALQRFGEVTLFGD